jgi:lycopene beta-cyclase
MTTEVELLIVGGGCAGLSLAMHLAADPQNAPRTLILEARSHYENDKTWCFWGDETTPFAAQAAHQWRHVSVRNAGQVTRLDCAAAPYRMLAAEQFYAAALKAIHRAPKLQLQLNSPLLSEAQFRGGRWHVETPLGALSAALVVDTRPPLPSAVDTLLWQSFYGHDITCEQPVFDPSCAELMDFSSASAERVAFSYVLPMSPTRALVEFTVFAAQPLSAAALAADLEAVIGQRVQGAGFTLQRSEHGVLPMGQAQSPAAASAAGPAASYARAGLFAGAARPATGYAFQRIQRWAADCAGRLTSSGRLVGHRPDPSLLAWMDRLFLSVIQRQPQGAPELFAAMFARVDSQRLIRFLSDRGRLADHAAMVLALPIKPFVQQLFRPRS